METPLADMSLYYLHASKFLDEFLPLPSNTPLNPKPANPNFSKILGMTSEKSISEEWVSNMILRLLA